MKLKSIFAINKAYNNATCSESWYYKTSSLALRLGKTVHQTKKHTSRNPTLIFPALVCTVLIAGIAILVGSLLTNPLPTHEYAINDIISDSTAWEGKTVKVKGTIQRTALGVILPFNYWLHDKANQTICIGVKWDSEADLSGKDVNVIGITREGYAWTHPDYPRSWVHFIEASSMY